MTGVSPNPHADGHDGFGLCDELVPGVAADVEDGVVVIEDAVREPVLAEVLPDALDRVQFGRSGPAGPGAGGGTQGPARPARDGDAARVAP